MLDPISDMLTRIKNSQKAGHGFVLIPFSKIKVAIAKVFRSEGFIEDVIVENNEFNKNFDTMRIVLKYNFVSSISSKPAITYIKQVSKQGQRCYVRKLDINKIKNGFGSSVISTSQGVMSGREARKKNLGGELICEIW